MPPDLLNRATQILTLLEQKHGSDGDESIKKIRKQQPAAATFQLNIFDGLTEDIRRIQQTLEETDINTLTPVEALLKLNEMKEIVKSYQ